MSDVSINPRRVPLKGKPNFTALSDEKMGEYKKLLQDLIFAYEHCDKDITVAMKKAFKQIADNLTDRLNYDTMNVLSSKQEKQPKEVDEVMKKTFQKPKRIKVLKSI